MSRPRLARATQAVTRCNENGAARIVASRWRPGQRGFGRRPPQIKLNSSSLSVVSQGEELEHFAWQPESLSHSWRWLLRRFPPESFALIRLKLRRGTPLARLKRTGHSWCPWLLRFRPRRTSAGRAILSIRLSSPVLSRRESRRRRKLTGARSSGGSVLI